MNIKIKRVVFLTLSPLSERDYSRFGIKILEDNNFDVQVIYIGNLVYGVKNNSSFSTIVKSVNSYSQFEQMILNLGDNSIFVKLFGLSSQMVKIDWILSKLDVSIVRISLNSIPLTMEEVNFFKKVKSLFRGSLIRKIVFLYYIKILKIKIDKYMMLGGVKSDKTRDPSIVKIWTHALDYDIFLEQNRVLNRDKNSGFCLYLDEYIPYHPDFKKIGIDKKYSAIADSYYQKMNSFFDKIEKAYNLKVIIAAHPRAEYNKLGDVWNGRKIIFGKSIELVKDSDFCMMHASTSINFAILYKKPILFLSLKELEPLYGSFIDSFSKEVANSKIFIDDEFDKKHIDNSLIIDDNMYDKYKENYIKKSGTPEKNSWQIFADFIKRENGEIENV